MRRPEFNAIHVPEIGHTILGTHKLFPSTRPGHCTGCGTDEWPSLQASTGQSTRVQGPRHLAEMILVLLAPGPGKTRGSISALSTRNQSKKSLVMSRSCVEFLQGVHRAGSNLRRQDISTMHDNHQLGGKPPQHLRSTPDNYEWIKRGNTNLSAYRTNKQLHLLHADGTISSRIYMEMECSVSIRKLGGTTGVHRQGRSSYATVLHWKCTTTAMIVI